MMHIMLVPELAVQMIVETGEDDRTARAAAGSGAIRMLEPRSLTRELVDVWCLNDRVPVAPRVPTPVVADKQDHILPRRGKTSAGRDEDEHQELAQERLHEARHHEISG